MSASLAFLQKGHLVFEKTITLLPWMKVVAVSFGLAARVKLDFMTLNPCLEAPLPKKATDVEIMMSKRMEILAREFIYEISRTQMSGMM